MQRQTVIKFLVSLFVFQQYILDTHQTPLLHTTGYNLSVNEDNIIIYTEPTLPSGKDVSSTKNEGTSYYDNETLQLSRTNALQKFKEQIVLSKHIHHRVYATDPEDILFMMTALVLMCFHLFFMDMFIRLTRTRFQTNSRYQYLSTVHLFLSFLVCAVYFLLILLHYRNSQYCG